MIGSDGLLSDDCRKLACFEESGRAYRAVNSRARRMLCYRVDGGVIREGERCDYALGIPYSSVVCLIELKGKDLKKAAGQLLSTLQTLEPILKPYIVHGRIVLSRVQRPDLRASAVIRLERKLARQGGGLRRSTIVMTEDIEDLGA